MSRTRIQRYSALLLLLLIFDLVTQPAAIAAVKVQPSAVQAAGTATPKPAATEEGAPAPPISPHVAAPPAKATPVPTATVAPTPLPAATAFPEEPAVGPASRWVNTENYLILGTDRRPDSANWRTDTVMVLGIDRAQGHAALLSIPRDLFVQIPNYGWGRINQVDYLGEQRSPNGGGPALVSQVLSQTLGIATNHWVRMQMDGFISIVDAVGGVTIHLDCPFYEPVFNNNTQAWDYFTLPAGDVHLDGNSAFWFVRLRLRESDIGRARRQRQFLWALRDQAMNANLITRIPELWSAFQTTVSTDLSLLDMVGLARFGIDLEPGNVRAGGLTLSDLQNFTTAQGAAVLRIANPNHVRAVVNGVWDAPAMAATNQQDPAACPALPAGVTVGENEPPAVAATQPTTKTVTTNNP